MLSLCILLLCGHKNNVKVFASVAVKILQEVPLNIHTFVGFDPMSLSIMKANPIFKNAFLI